VELGTFGAIIKFAMDIESKVNNFYQTASETVKDTELVSIITDLVVQENEDVRKSS